MLDQGVKLEAKVSLLSTIEDGFRKIIYKIFQKILLVISHFIVLLLADVKIFGKENIAGIKKGPLLIISNHKSNLDPLLVGVCFPFFSKVYPLRFIAKDQLFVKWHSRIIYNLLGAYPSFSGQGLEKSLSIPKKILSEGGCVVFFPEGKRIRGEEIGKGKIGAAVLANTFPEIPIIPVAVSNPKEIGSLGLFYKRPRIKLMIGKPFCLNEKCVGKTDGEVIEILMDEIKKVFQTIV